MVPGGFPAVPLLHPNNRVLVVSKVCVSHDGAIRRERNETKHRLCRGPATLENMSIVVKADSGTDLEQINVNTITRIVCFIDIILLFINDKQHKNRGEARKYAM
jgi:hypothetical protein